MYIYYNVHDNQIDEDPPLTNHATRISQQFSPMRHLRATCSKHSLGDGSKLAPRMIAVPLIYVDNWELVYKISMFLKLEHIYIYLMFIVNINPWVYSSILTYINESKPKQEKGMNMIADVIFTNQYL